MVNKFDMLVIGESFTTDVGTYVQLAHKPIVDGSEIVKYSDATYGDFTYEKDKDYLMDYTNGKIQAKQTNIVDESVTLSTTVGSHVALTNDNIVPGTVTVTDSTGATTYTEGTDYEINYPNGTIAPLTTALAGATVLVDYTFGMQDGVTAVIDYTWRIEFSGGNTPRTIRHTGKRVQKIIKIPFDYPYILDMGRDVEKWSLEGMCDNSTRKNLEDLKKNWSEKFVATIEDINGVLYEGDAILVDVRYQVDRRSKGRYVYVVTIAEYKEY